jgi:hypothetical protein
VLPVAKDAVIIVGAVLIVVTVAGAFLGFSESQDKRNRFERCYATVDARLTEGVWWLARHAWRAARDSERGERVLPAIFAATTVVTTALLPAAALKASQAGLLSRQGIAAGVGALVWGCILEGTSLPERIAALVRRPVWSVELWKIAVILGMADVALVTVGLAHNFASEVFGAAISGAAFVAGADIVSLLVGFVLCPWEPYPLVGPESGP